MNKLPPSVKNFVNAVMIAGGLVSGPAIFAALTTSCEELEQRPDNNEKEKQPEYLAWDVTLKKGDKIEANNMEVMSYGGDKKHKTIVKCESGTKLESVDLNGNVIRKNGVSTPYSTENLKEGEYPLNFTVARSDGIIYKADKRIITIEGEEPLEINKLEGSVNIFGGAEVKVENNQLLVGNIPVVSWEKGSVIGVKVYFNGEEKKLPCVLFDPGTLKIEFDGGNTSASVNVTLTCEGVSGLDELVANLNSQGLRVGDSIDVTEIKPAKGVEICGFYMMDGDGNKTEIEDPKNCKLTKVGNFYIGVELQGTGGGKDTQWSKNSIEVYAKIYKEPNIPIANPADYIDVLGNMTSSEKNYHKEALSDWYSVADLIGMISMIGKYVANAEKQFKKIRCCMMYEVPPDGIVELEILGNNTKHDPDQHSGIGAQYFSHLINKTSIPPLLVADTDKPFSTVCDYAKAHPDEIIICVISWSGTTLNRQEYEGWGTKNILKEISEAPDNLIFSMSLGNWMWVNGEEIIFTCQEEVNPLPPNSGYTLCSMAYPGGRIFVSCANGPVGGGRYPIGFDKDVLLGSGEPIPYGEDNNRNSYFTQGKTSELNWYNGLKLMCIAGLERVANNSGDILPQIKEGSNRGKVTLDNQSNDVRVLDDNDDVRKYMPKLPTEIDFAGEDVIPLEKGLYPLIGLTGTGIVAKVGNEWLPYDEDNTKRIQEEYPNPEGVAWGISSKVLSDYGINLNDGVGREIEIKMHIYNDKREEFGNLLNEEDSTVKIMVRNTVISYGDEKDMYVPNLEISSIPTNKELADNYGKWGNADISYYAGVPQMPRDINDPQYKYEIDSSKDAQVQLENNDKTQVMENVYVDNTEFLVDTNKELADNYGKWGNGDVSYYAGVPQMSRDINDPQYKYEIDSSKDAQIQLENNDKNQVIADIYIDYNTESLADINKEENNYSVNIINTLVGYNKTDELVNTITGYDSSNSYRIQKNGIENEKDNDRGIGTVVIA